MKRAARRVPPRGSSGILRQQSDAFLADQGVNAGEDLKNHAEHAKGHPAEEHEAPMQRSDEQFFHEPEGVAPFIQATFGMIMNGPIATIRNASE